MIRPFVFYYRNKFRYVKLAVSRSLYLDPDIITKWFNKNAYKDLAETSVLHCLFCNYKNTQ